MDKTLQDLAWSILPKEFKEEVKKYLTHYRYAINTHEAIINHIFGKHNLTSDADGEEMLTVPRKKVQEMYSEALKAVPTCEHDRGYRNAEFAILKRLFGSKCLPDNANKDNSAKTEPTQFFESDYSIGDKVIVNVSSICEPRKEVVTLIRQYQPQCDYNDYKKTWVIWTENGQTYQSDEAHFEPYEEPKPAEPKFTKGDMVHCKSFGYEGDYKVLEYTGGPRNCYDCIDKYGAYYRFYESDLEPYTEPQPATERSNLNKESSTCTDDCPSQCSSKHRNLLQETVNCDKQLDNLLKDSFSKERRLNIATMIVQGVLSNPNIIRSCSDFEDSDEYIVKTALMYTDTLLDECEKGGCHD